MICYTKPSKTTKDYIMYKKVIGSNGAKYLLELFVPKGSYMYSPLIFRHERNYRKIRVSQVVVLKAWTIRLKETKCKTFHPLLSKYNNIEYRVGELVKPNSFDKRPVSCSNGIHGFFNPDDAIFYIP